MSIESHSDPADVEFRSCSADVAIQIKNGTAIITGTVCTPEDKLKTESAVRLMLGIDRIFNRVETN